MPHDTDKDSLTFAAIASWSRSESSLIAAINLQIEKEKIKKESLRTSNLEKTKEVIDKAVEAGIPREEIPLIFGNSINFGESLSLAGGGTVSSTEMLDAPASFVPSSSAASSANPASASAAGNSYSTAASSANIPASLPRAPNQLSAGPPSSTVSRPYTHSRGTSRSQSSSSSSSAAPTTSVFKVNLPQSVNYQFLHYQGPKRGGSPELSPQLESSVSTVTSPRTAMSPSSPLRFSHVRHASEASPKITKSRHSRQSSMDPGMRSFVFPPVQVPGPATASTAVYTGFVGGAVGGATASASSTSSTSAAKRFTSKKMTLPFSSPPLPTITFSKGESSQASPIRTHHKSRSKTDLDFVMSSNEDRNDN